MNHGMSNATGRSKAHSPSPLTPAPKNAMAGAAYKVTVGTTTRPVDNSATASPEPTSPEPCSAFGEIRRWGR